MQNIGKRSKNATSQYLSPAPPAFNIFHKTCRLYEIHMIPVDTSTFTLSGTSYCRSLILKTSWMKGAQK